MKVRNSIELVQRHPRLASYCMAVEAIYVLYEFALTRGIHDGSGLALGLVLTVLTLPSVMIAGWLQWHVAELLGFTPGDAHAFWPRFIAWQVPIVLNAALFAFWAARRAASGRKDTRTGDV